MGLPERPINPPEPSAIEAYEAALERFTQREHEYEAMTNKVFSDGNREETKDLLELVFDDDPEKFFGMLAGVIVDDDPIQFAHQLRKLLEQKIEYQTGHKPSDLPPDFGEYE